jgi:hypothetical protein
MEKYGGGFFSSFFVELLDKLGLVMRKVEDLDVSSPYLDLETFKQVLSEFCNRDPNEPFPPLQPLPPKPSIEKFGIVRKEISGGSSFKD